MDAKLNSAFASDRHQGKVHPHHHNCHELVFYSSGANGNTLIGDKSYDFSAGGVAFIRKETVHSEEHYSKCGVICVLFDTDCDMEDLYIPDLHKLKSTFEQIIDEVHEQEYGYEEIAACKIKEIILKIMREIETSHNKIKTLAHCKKYMKENFSQNIKISDIASMIGYSPDHFRHMFKKTYGISPQAYIIEKRLSYAYGTIVTGDLSFAEIAEICGFSNLSQLTRMIKARYGQTPTQIRYGRRRLKR